MWYKITAKYNPSASSSSPLLHSIIREIVFPGKTQSQITFNKNHFMILENVLQENITFEDYTYHPHILIEG